jgi:uncharacterized protein YrrD
MSLQTGAELARTTEIIVDPRSLSIVAIYVDGASLDVRPSVLHTADIRELGPIGCIVDDSSALMELDGLVRLEEIVNFNFKLFGMPVIDEDGRKLGKVEDITFESDGYTVQQLITHQSILSSLTNASHVIGRSQVVTITSEHIIVRSASIAHEISNSIQQGAAMMNPFKKPQTEHHSDESS